MITFIPVMADHVTILANNLREEDQQEVARSHSIAPADLIEECVKHSEECFTILDGDILMGMAGVCPASILSGTASPWLLSTEYAAQHPRALVRFTKPVIQRWLSQYSYLFNFIDAEYEAALRWAKWAGFTVSEPLSYGPKGAPFCKVEIRRG